MDGYNNDKPSKSRWRPIRPLYALAVVPFVVVGLIAWNALGHHSDPSGDIPVRAERFMPPPEPVERGTPGILTSIDDTVRACSDWRISDHSFPGQRLESVAEAARVVAVCSFLTGQRTSVKAGGAVVSLDVPSIAVGFALALFLWGVLAGLGSMFRSAFRRAPGPPTPRRLASVEPFEPEWRRGG